MHTVNSTIGPEIQNHQPAAQFLKGERSESMFSQSSPCVNLGPALCLNACGGSYVALHLRLGLGHRTLLTKYGPQCLQATRNVRIALGTLAEIFPSDGSSIGVYMSRSIIH